MLKEIKNGLQIESETHRLEATNVAIDKPLNPSDLDTIKKARLKGRSFADKVNADLSLIDRATGRVLDKSRVHVADIPVQTPFKTYLVDGAHYQAKNQSQLKGTAYTEMTQAGDVRSQFRTERGSNFQILFDPESEKFRMKVKHSHVGLAPILQTLGVNEDAMHKTWGKGIAPKNVVDEPTRQKEIKKFAKTVFGDWRIKDRSDKEIDSMVVDHFLKESVLNPEASEKTLGAPFKNVTAEALIAASNKIIGIHKGKVEPDKKDEIFFKRMRGLAETSTDFIQNALPGIQRKIAHRLTGERRVGEIVPLDAFRRPIKSVFTTNGLQGAGETTNFVDILSEDGRVTIMGEGGITDTHKVKRDAMDIHLSSLGFIDPVMTSAGTAGMTEHLAVGAQIKGNKIYAPFIDMKTKKTVQITPEMTIGKVVGFPDGPSKDGLNKAVLDGELIEVTENKIDYRVPNAKLMFSDITNLIPFIQNDSGSRAIFGTGQYTQAVTLEDREAPLTQTLFSTKNGKKISFEKMIGNQASIISPVGGTVSRVSMKSITIRGGGGSTHTVPLYDNMPLNQSGFLHNNPLVKTGDKVVARQVIALSNNTKNGVLALGRNLITAIMPWKGYFTKLGSFSAQKQPSVY